MVLLFPTKPIPPYTVVRPTPVLGIHTDYTNADGHLTSNGLDRILPSKITTTYYGGTSPLVKSVSYTYDQALLYAWTLCPRTPLNNDGCTAQLDNTDNISSITETDFAGNTVRTTSNTWKKGGRFDGNTGHMLDRLLSKTVADGVSNVSETNSYDYYANGNMASSSVSGTSASTLSTTYTYTSTGDLFTKTDPLNYVTTYGYAGSWYDSSCAATASSGGKPTSVKNALNQTTLLSYYSCTGLLAQTTDPNKAVTSYQYDALGRKVLQTNADLGTLTTTFADSAPNSVTTSQTTGQGSSIVHKTVLDGLSSNIPVAVSLRSRSRRTHLRRHQLRPDRPCPSSQHTPIAAHLPVLPPATSTTPWAGFFTNARPTMSRLAEARAARATGFLVGPMPATSSTPTTRTGRIRNGATTHLDGSQRCGSPPLEATRFSSERTIGMTLSAICSA